MSQSKLATEIRTQAQRFIDSEMTLREFRVWFNDADRRVNRGRPSGLIDDHLVAISDEIQDALSDLDSGDIDLDRLMQVLSVVIAVPRGTALSASPDTAVRHLYWRPTSAMIMTPDFVPA